MTEPLTPAEDRLIESLAGSSHGPRRNGTYVLWLFVRTCGGLLPPEPLSDLGQRGRLAGLQRRIKSLTLPGPLRRALAGGVRELADGTTQAAAIALQQLVAPARESVGTEAGDAVALAARVVRELVREMRG